MKGSSYPHKKNVFSLLISLSILQNMNIVALLNVPIARYSLLCYGHHPCSAASGCTRVAETHPTAAPGSKKKNEKFKMFNGNDSGIFVVIVGQCCSA